MPPLEAPLAVVSPFGLIGMASVAAVLAFGGGALAIVLRPFTRLYRVGRRCANQSLVGAVIALPLFLLAGPGTNVPSRIYGIGFTTLAVGLLSSAVYIRRPRHRDSPGVA